MKGWGVGGEFPCVFPGWAALSSPLCDPTPEGPSGFPAPTPAHPHQGASVQASKVAECLFCPRSGVGIRLGTGAGDPVQEGPGSQGIVGWDH